MSTSRESNPNTLETLKSYKKLTKIETNHEILLKDKTIILYAASLLDGEDKALIKLSLDIIEDFVQNDKTHQILVSTFGIFEALESLSIRLRTRDAKLANRSTVMVDVLRKSAPPAYSTRLRTKGKHNRKVTAMYQLYIPNMTPDNRQHLEEMLVQIKGLISFVVDLEQQKCTVRIGPKITINAVITKILEKCGLKALLVSKNPNEVNEVYIDIFNASNKPAACPEYFIDDEETPPKGKAVSSFPNITKNAGDWFKSAAEFWNKSFYW